MNGGMKQKDRVKSMLFAAGLIVIAIVFAIISYQILPEQVATKFGGVEAGGSMSRITAVLIPFSVSIVGAVSSVENKRNGWIALIGYATNILLWILN